MPRLSDKRGLARRTWAKSRRLAQWRSRYTHDPAEADEAAENLREAIRDRVAYELELATVWKLQWCTAPGETAAGACASRPRVWPQTPYGTVDSVWSWGAVPPAGRRIAWFKNDLVGFLLPARDPSA
jgi:hypothetical protein